MTENQQHTISPLPPAQLLAPRRARGRTSLNLLANQFASRSNAAIAPITWNIIRPPACFARSKNPSARSFLRC